MADRYAIDVNGFLDLASRTARRLDSLAEAVFRVLFVVDEVRDAVALTPDLARAFARAVDPWVERATALAEHGGAVLSAAERAVIEYCRADAAMAVDTGRAAGSRGHGRWRVS
ncbi:hypothetical protein FHS07_002383 [Microbacterium proteolyticum]|uniref:Uncharacterized protein n=1 Tax=Microbacterium proteolyticum TaxID=1572644 RepID=A0A7W5CJ78_9MICO|nr:hypothetical protein [Microbacterium proteolyticum]MBB3158687.1 hypothetical protein [Microbacterium proteolyticum]